MSQGHYLTALKLWGTWQARHSTQDLGLAAILLLLVACAEVRDFGVGQALLPHIRPTDLFQTAEASAAGGVAAVAAVAATATAAVKSSSRTQRSMAPALSAPPALTPLCENAPSTARGTNFESWTLHSISLHYLHGLKIHCNLKLCNQVLAGKKIVMRVEAPSPC